LTEWRRSKFRHRQRCRAYLDRAAANREDRILDLLDVWAAEVADPDLKREAVLIKKSAVALRPDNGGRSRLAST
jgi:hypothetical protein